MYNNGHPLVAAHGYVPFHQITLEIKTSIVGPPGVSLQRRRWTCSLALTIEYIVAYLKIKYKPKYFSPQFMVISLSEIIYKCINKFLIAYYHLGCDIVQSGRILQGWRACRASRQQVECLLLPWPTVTGFYLFCSVQTSSGLHNIFPFHKTYF